MDVAKAMRLADAYGHECCRGNEYDNRTNEAFARKALLDYLSGHRKADNATIAAVRTLAATLGEALEHCLKTYCTPLYPDEIRAHTNARTAIAAYEAAKKEGLL